MLLAAHTHSQVLGVSPAYVVYSDGETFLYEGIYRSEGINLQFIPHSDAIKTTGGTRNCLDVHCRQYNGNVIVDNI